MAHCQGQEGTDFPRDIRQLKKFLTVKKFIEYGKIWVMFIVKEVDEYEWESHLFSLPDDILL